MRGAAEGPRRPLPRPAGRQQRPRPRRPAGDRGARRPVSLGGERTHGDGLMASKLTLTTWSLPACSLKEAAGIAKVLGIGAIDVGYFFGPGPRQGAAPRRSGARRRRGAGARYRSRLPLSPLRRHACRPQPRRPAPSRDQNVADLKQAVRFCKRAGIGVIFVLPGVCQSGPGAWRGAGEPRPRASGA